MISQESLHEMLNCFAEDGTKFKKGSDFQNEIEHYLKSQGCNIEREYKTKIDDKNS